jgi:hypothetical protein
MGVHVNVIGGPIPFDTRIAGPATEMAKALLLFLGQVELIYKQERVAPARESGKTAQAHAAGRGGPGRRVQLRETGDSSRLVAVRWG